MPLAILSGCLSAYLPASILSAGMHAYVRGAWHQVMMFVASKNDVAAQRFGVSGAGMMEFIQ